MDSLPAYTNRLEGFSRKLDRACIFRMPVQAWSVDNVPNWMIHLLEDPLQYITPHHSILCDAISFISGLDH
jgi:hypothetical protein